MSDSTPQLAAASVGPKFVVLLEAGLAHGSSGPSLSKKDFPDESELELTCTD